MDAHLFSRIAAVVVPLVYLVGILHAIQAIMTTRTSQGATAWALALTLIPFISLPFYWVFGSIKFDEYVESLRSLDAKLEKRLEDARGGVLAAVLVGPDDEPDPRTRGELKAFQALATVPMTSGNSAKLLVNGTATFDAIFKAFDSASEYVLAQFYIINDDRLGQRFKDHLIAAARRGVKVSLLYDDVGSHALPRRYINELTDIGCRGGAVPRKPELARALSPELPEPSKDRCRRRTRRIRRWPQRR